MSTTDGSVRNQRIIIVGASRGLGRGIALAFAQAGARVLAIARDRAALEDLKKQNPERIDFLNGDGADAGFVQRVIAGENPDGVAIVMGATPEMRPIHEYSWEAYCEIWNNDVKATLHWLQGLIKKPMRQGGRVVVISSAAALRGSPLSGGYAPAKHAQRYICKYVREELEEMKRDLVVQCVLPQLNPHTDLGKVAVAAYAASCGEDPATFVQKRFGEKTLTPELAGAEMVRLFAAQSGSLRTEPEFLLNEAGLTPLPQ